MAEGQLQEELGRLREEFQQKVSEIDFISNDSSNDSSKADKITQLTSEKKELQTKIQHLLTQCASLEQEKIAASVKTGNVSSEVDKLAEESPIETVLDGDDEEYFLTDLTRKELEEILHKQTAKLKALRHKIRNNTAISNTQDEEEYKRLSDEIQGIQEVIDDKINEEQQLHRATRKFNKIYGQLKKAIYSIFYTHKEECIADELENDKDTIAKRESELLSAYEACRVLKNPPELEVRRRADHGSQMCKDMMNALIRLEENPAVEHAERKKILRATWDKDYSRSLFGSDLDNASQSVGTSTNHTQQTQRSDKSHQTHVSIKSSESVKSYRLAKLATQRKRLELKAKMMQHKTAMVMIEEQMELINEEERIQQEGNDYQESQMASRNLIEPQRRAENSKEQAKFKLENIAHTFPESIDKSILPVRIPLLSDRNPLDQTELKLETIAQTFSDSISRSKLPAPTPPIFDGDPLKFLNFKRSFFTLVDRKGIPSSDKLYYLQQYLTGGAKAAVEGCFFGDSEDAYHRAWDRLNKRFGHPFTVQQSLRKKLDDWPKVPYKDGNALLEYSDFLQTLLEAMTCVSGLSILNDCIENQRMVAKLPEWCANRWTRHVTVSMNQGKDYPSFTEFAEFVMEEAQVATNPICTNYGLAHNKQWESHQPGGEKRKGAYRVVHNTRVNMQETESEVGIPRQNSSCVMCKSTEHRLWKCPEFQETSYNDKILFIKSHRLCFKCLTQGHFSRDCTMKIICKICKRNHHSLLHFDESKTDANTNLLAGGEENGNGEPEAETTHAVSCKAQSEGQGNCTSMIVPVWVSVGYGKNKEVLTYALIDSQSDCSYISNDLAVNLEMTPNPVRMKISTLTSTSIVDCHRYENVRLRGWNMTTEVWMRSCYTRNDIPCNKDHIPSVAAVRKIPHLAHIAPFIPPIQDCKVGLLIGFNCPQALRPVETVSGGNEDCFAIKTDLGWSVVGGHDQQYSEIASICHRITSKELSLPTPNDVKKVLDQDFQETKGDVSYSQDDLTFLKCLEEGIRVNQGGNISMPLPLKDNFKLRRVVTTQEAIDSTNQSISLCKKTGVRLHRFLSNSKEVLQEVIPFEQASVVSENNLEMEALPMERTLGAAWDIENYCFTFNVNFKSQPITRRGILSTVASVFDPFGYASPIILPGNQTLQEFCKNHKSWDVSQSLNERWEKWKKGLLQIDRLKVLRCFRPKQMVSEAQRNMKVGDIVLLVDETAARCDWPLGLVIKAEPDPDGLVRKVSLRISNINMVSKGTKQKKYFYIRKANTEAGAPPSIS